MANVHDPAVAAMEDARAKCSVAEARTYHRRGNFASLTTGQSHGGGQLQPGVFVNWAPHVYEYYAINVRSFYRRNPDLKRPFINGIWSACTFNLGEVCGGVYGPLYVMLLLRPWVHVGTDRHVSAGLWKRLPLVKGGQAHSPTLASMLRALFNLFFPTKPHDSKMGTLVESLTPTKRISGVLDSSNLSMSTTGWLQRLEEVDTDEERLDALNRCFVDQVDHFRGVDTKKAHEKTAFTFHLASANPAEASARFANGCHAARFPHSNVRRLSAQSANCTGKDSFNSDAVRIDATYGELRLTSEYLLVQTFIVPAGTPASQRLTALDCAILASVITTRAQDYSNLCYMCMWYATTFFLAAKQICTDRGYPPADSSAGNLKRGGRYGKLRLVDPSTGRLSLASASSVDVVKKAIEKGMAKSGVPAPQVEDFLQRLDDDRARIGNMGTDSVGSIVRLFQVRREQVLEGMSRIATVRDNRMAVERRIQAAERQMQEAQQQAQAADVRAQAAERRAQVAEEALRATAEPTRHVEI
ncbi:hypothetical protein B0H13DRAFT_1896450 [Mycena leptocephala]|nr:hypothetical protein B0H13DRAFT_1896450 [Mycena leptocephala]